MRPTPAPSESPRVQLRTLGCRLNQAESDEIRAAFRSRGYDPDSGSEPDVVVVNTCTVTGEATKASRKLIRRTIAEFPAARVFVTGCYADAEPLAVAGIPGVHGVVSNRDKDTLADRIAGAGSQPLSPLVARSGPRANLKVQTGCDESCAFCIVPLTRGDLSSRSPERVREEARRLVDAGAREIVLTGVHLGKYGWGRGHRHALPALVEELCTIDELVRVRLSSIEASRVDDALLEVMAGQPKVCPHLHLPLQTGDPDIWRAMQRPGTLDDLRKVAAAARRLIPDVSLTTDVMVGFPGETEEAFGNTLRVVEELGFVKLHVFRFSPRPGTPAARLPFQVDASVKRDRSGRLRDLGDRLRQAWHRSQLGRTVDVLFEGPIPGSRLSGITGHYLRVIAPGPARLVGTLVPTLVTSVGGESVEGEIVGRLPVLQDRRRVGSV